MTAHFKNLVFFIIFTVGYLILFTFWIQNLRKLHFTNLSNPKNPNWSLDYTDYGCEIRL